MSRFDKLAQEWDLNPRRVESAKNTTSKIKELIDIRDKDIIDYGSGSGLVAFDLFEEARSVVAMDNSTGMLQEIENKIQKSDIKNITTLLHDIDHEELEEGKFDIFVSAMTMHHIKDTKAFLQKAKNSLKKGGYIAISDLESEDGSFHSRGNDGVEHFGFDLENIREIFESIGMEIVFLEIIETISKEKDFNIFLVVAKNV